MSGLIQVSCTKLRFLYLTCCFALGSAGALVMYVPSLELMNRKLPFGLAETGVCYLPEDEHDSAAIGW